MANAPDWNRDEKKAREGGLRRAASLDAERFRQGGIFGEGGLVRGTASDLAAVPAKIIEGNRQIAGAIDPILFGDRNVRAQAAQREAATAPPPATPAGAMPRADFSAVRGGQTPNLRDPRNGLTRIVKTADGAYTDAAGAQGEVRYYDRTGIRADTNPVAMPGNTPIDVQRAAERATAMDMSDPNNARIVAERGVAGLRRSDAMLAESSQRTAANQFAALPPEEQAALQAARIREQGESARANATNQITMRGQDLTAQTAAAGNQRSAASDALAQDRWLRERSGDPETAVAFMQEELGALANLPPNERIAALADPNDPNAGRLRETLRRQLAQVTGNNDVTPAQVQKTGALRRFLTGSEYTDNSGWGLGNGFSPGDLGLTDEQFIELVNGDRTVRSR